MSTLEICNLRAQVLPTDESAESKEILKGISPTINSGEAHVVMDPSGSGKLVLSYIIAGHSCYGVIEGEILLDGEDVLEMSVDEYARASLFLTMQCPMEVTGVSVPNLLHFAATTVRDEAPKLRHWVKGVREVTASLEIDFSFPECSVNESFSGGEKKRHEILQPDLLKPKFVILDETDSGLDVDALCVVSEGINQYQNENGGGTLIITHYQCILNYVRPDLVHIFHDDHFITSGGSKPTDELEEYDYEEHTSA